MKKTARNEILLAVLIILAASIGILISLRTNLIIGLISTLITELLIYDSVVVIKPVRFGVVLRFKRRTGRILREGLNFVLPIIDTVEVYDQRIGSESIPLSFFSKDNLEVILKFMVQWYPDPTIFYKDSNVSEKENLNRFMANTEETIASGISEVIKSIVGNIIGKVSAYTFIDKKKAVGRYIDCVLRLKRPPHVYPSTLGFTKEEFERFSEEVKRGKSGMDFKEEIRKKIEECKRKEDEIEEECLKETNQSPETGNFFKKINFDSGEELDDVNQRVRYYHYFSSLINELLREEKHRPDEHSDIETRYGIEMVISELSEVDFSPATKKSMELLEQTKRKLKADQEESNKLQKITGALKGLGIDSSKALDAALVIMDQAKKNIISLEGIDFLKEIIKSARKGG